MIADAADVPTAAAKQGAGAPTPPTPASPNGTPPTEPAPSTIQAADASGNRLDRSWAFLSETEGAGAGLDDVVRSPSRAAEDKELE